MSNLRLANVSHFDASWPPSLPPSPKLWVARDLYENLLSAPPRHWQEAQAFLDQHLEQAGALPCDLPKSPHDLQQWMQHRTAAVTHAYNQYLQARKQGAPRRYFHNRSHALFFLRAVAPTKLVDGAWLYGLLPQWRDARLHPLVRTYLEELGDGVPSHNHVMLYRQLLIAHGCDDLASLGDEHYMQGALQLALGHLAAHYLPEVIGFNLGYEQLPLHLLISAYELDELGIDPWYFKLHVTIDNAATGHAQKATQAVTANLPQIADADEFYRRIALGYRLNDIGVGSLAAIAAFDLDRELLQMLERKRAFARNVHSDYCRIDGRTVNQWLNGAESIKLFLDALQTRGWINRHADPQDSRFWQLVQGERAAMFGVFTDYEQQLLYDWIAGDWQARSSLPQKNVVATERRRSSFRKIHAVDERDVGYGVPFSAETGVELLALDEELARLNPTQREQRLMLLVAPALHSTPAGLKATRILASLVR